MRPSFALLSLLILAPTAYAEDSLLDIDLGDFDLDEASVEESLTYEGSSTDSAPDYTPGKPVSITHYGGNITVNCTDRSGIDARLDYALEGTNRASMKRMGDGIGVRAWGSSSSGGVSTRIPSKGSGISSSSIPLAVNLPKSVRVTVTGKRGWITVRGCTGTVKATTAQDGIFVSGELTKFELTASKGDIEIELSESAKLASTSKAYASTGKISLSMPLDQQIRLDARGESVEVSHIVDGNVTDTRVTGNIGEGGPSLSLTAKGAVKVSSDAE